MKTKITILTLIIFTFLSVPAHSYWIWTPETGRWINPKYAVKDSPSEQLEWAMGFYNAEDYDRAIKEFRKLIRHYPLSPLAAEAQYHIALSLEDLDKYYLAFRAYQKVIDTYPYSKRIEEVIERQYRIGELFYGGRKRKILGMSILPARDKAIEIFRAVVDNAPYGKYADAAQYKIGLCFKENKDFTEARLEFEKLLEEYPDSQYVDDARHQIALCSLKSSLEYAYDQSYTDKALRELKRIIIEAPRADINEQKIDKAISDLRDKKAKKDYKTGEFYERQGHIRSAEIYYNDVIKDFPGSVWAAKALERLRVIEKKE